MRSSQNGSKRRAAQPGEISNGLGTGWEFRMMPGKSPNGLASFRAKYLLTRTCFERTLISKGITAFWHAFPQRGLPRSALKENEVIASSICVFSSIAFFAGYSCKPGALHANSFSGRSMLRQEVNGRERG